MNDLKQGALAGVASAVSVTFTNPFDNAKTRLQLQNELVKKGYGKVEYKNVFHTVKKTFTDEGIRGELLLLFFFLFL
jgi:solute carrier family 25 protein 34/35